MTALETMRALCLALADTTEAPHFGDVVFKVGKKIFASYGERELVVQLEPTHATALVANDPRFSRYTKYGAKDCVTVDPRAIDDWELVRGLVAESHRLNTRKKTAKKKTPKKKKKTAKKKTK
jgi:hypothetical protein